MPSFVVSFIIQITATSSSTVFLKLALGNFSGSCRKQNNPFIKRDLGLLSEKVLQWNPVIKRSTNREIKFLTEVPRYNSKTDLNSHSVLELRNITGIFGFLASVAKLNSILGFSQLNTTKKAFL